MDEIIKRDKSYLLIIVPKALQSNQKNRNLLFMYINAYNNGSIL